MVGQTDIPKVSVVMATYNRSNIIAYSIESLQRSSFQDWELIVIGDCCTDDTETVVAGLGDPRIRFENLLRNCGEQSGPNNEGVARARGQYIAFLNHDDFWLPDHLERAVAKLEADPSVDIAFGIGLGYVSDTDPPILLGLSSDGRYHPAMVAPASLWVMRKEVIDRVGPWRHATTIRAMPSQDWLYRAHRARAHIESTGALAAILPYSGFRKGSYSSRQTASHEYFSRKLQEPDFLANELLRYARTWEGPRFSGRPGKFLGEAARTFSRSVLSFLGVFPPSPLYLLSHPRKGQFLHVLRKRRGLQPHADFT